MLRVGLINRGSLISLSIDNKTVEGALAWYLIKRVNILTNGLNLTWSIGANHNRGCLKGVCQQMATKIQKNNIDLFAESTQLFMFDSIYPNVTLSPPIVELDCAFLSYIVGPSTRLFNDILTTLQVFTSSTIIFLLTLLTLAFLLRHFPLWSTFYCQFIRKSSMVTIDGPRRVKIVLPKLTASILSLVLLQFQSWYSASFQTNLVTFNQIEPIQSLTDLSNRQLRAYVATTSNCYRGLLVQGKDGQLDPTVNNSLLINRNNDLIAWANSTITRSPLVVFFGNTHELNRIRKEFSNHPHLHTPRIVKVKASTIQDVYMYSGLLPFTIRSQLLSRLHHVLSGDLFWEKSQAIDAAQTAAELDYQKAYLSVHFQPLKIENYQYITGLYLIFLITVAIIFFTPLLIKQLINYFHHQTQLESFTKRQSIISIPSSIQPQEQLSLPLGESSSHLNGQETTIEINQFHN